MSWVDITSVFHEGVKDLSSETPMASSSSFQLFDAMNATELFDPKMDQYCSIPEGEETNIECVLSHSLDGHVSPIVSSTKFWIF